MSPFSQIICIAEDIAAEHVDLAQVHLALHGKAKKEYQLD